MLRSLAQSFLSVGHRSHFTGEAEVINASKLAILLASLAAVSAGFARLKLLGQPVACDEDMDEMGF